MSGPAQAVCLIKGPGNWFVWWLGGDQLSTHDLDAAIKCANNVIVPRATDPEATLYGVWLGTHNTPPVPQLTIGKRKPAHIQHDDIVGKRIFTGRWAAAWDTFATHARML